jgi:hypothetical protein
LEFNKTKNRRLVERYVGKVIQVWMNADLIHPQPALFIFEGGMNE